MSAEDAFKMHDYSMAYTTMTLFSSGPVSGQAAEIACGSLGARFDMDDDLSALFPYINAVAEHARFYEKPVFIKFLLAGHLCAFYPRQGAFAPVRDLAEAMAFLPRLLDFIVDVSRTCSRD